MQGKNNKPYKMYPGMHSEVNPGNFKGTEVKKYAPFMYNPHLTDLSGDGKITKKDKLIKVGAEGFKKGMDKPSMHHAKKYKD